MTNATHVRPKPSNAVMILRGRIDVESIEKCFSASAGILSTLDNSLKSMPKVLVSFDLSTQWKKEEDENDEDGREKKSDLLLGR